jgi:hypothetical protein
VTKLTKRSWLLRSVVRYLRQKGQQEAVDLASSKDSEHKARSILMRARIQVRLQQMQVIRCVVHMSCM